MLKHLDYQRGLLAETTMAVEAAVAAAVEAVAMADRIIIVVVEATVVAMAAMGETIRAAGTMEPESAAIAAMAVVDVVVVAAGTKGQLSWPYVTDALPSS